MNLPFSGAVFVGGSSRRMGRDKATFPVAGVPMGRRAVDALRDAGAVSVGLVGARPEHAGLGGEPVADHEPGAGPLVALRSALAWAPTFPLVTLPCDLPEVTAADVAALVAAYRSLRDGPARPPEVVVARVDGRSVPVVAVWSEHCAVPVAAAVARGERSLRAVIESIPSAHHAGGPGLRDADTPGDLRHNRYRVRMDAVPQIDVDELAERRSTGAVVLDVRQPAEYDEAHVPGAILIPLGELPDRVGEVPATDSLVVICKSGGRSQRACEFLATVGIGASNVTGGTMAWIESGREVATGMERG